MTNELLEVEVSCAIFTHIITVSVATVTAVQRKWGVRWAVAGGGCTAPYIHQVGREGGREEEGASDDPIEGSHTPDAVSDLIPGTNSATI